jgi:hypothetical protein
MSSFVLNRNYSLQLPSIFVGIDREEMEYVDGGGDFTQRWYGWDWNLGSSECADLSDAFYKAAAIEGSATAIISAAAACISGPGSLLPLVVGTLITLNFTLTAIDLNTASRRGGATLTRFLGGFNVNIW